jgi:hypothetical protein
MVELNPNQELGPKAERPLVVNPEQPTAPEDIFETTERPESLPVEKKGEAQPLPKPAPPQVGQKNAKPIVVLAKSETVKEIENILSEGLEQAYQNLPANMQAQFRKKGEEAASKIEILISQTKIAVKNILFIIFEWLKIIPGVNRFFLEQESKIKTDKILALAEKNKKSKVNL